MTNKLRNFIIFGLTILTAFAIFVMSPTKAYACACCGYAGEWYQRTENLDSSQVETLNQLKFSPSANLYLTAAGFDIIKGISSNSETYTLSHSKNKRSWNFRLVDGSGKTGNLSLTLPEKMIAFGTDFYDQPTPNSRLYKELRMEGKVAGNGIFAAGMGSDSRFRLILQGRGNYCLNRTDFKHWNLQILGSGSSFSFYGFFEQ
ncbi:MAG: hypothetical protein ACKPEN_04025 [Planktothrix sp.]|uniref:hypothetical protein n=1 Tax=Planktothrix sp. TaxID=3088171 RepID=UPI0038D37AB6